MIQRFRKVFMSILPLAIIIGLLGAALFIKPKATGKSIDPPIFELRDRFYGVSLPGNNVIWIVGNNGKIIRSNDDGKSWARQAVPGTWHIQDIASWDGQRAVAVGNEGVILLTRDGGKTWNSVQSPLSAVANKLLRVKVLPDGRAWAVGEMGAVLVSGDQGSTWERKVPETDVAWNDIYFSSPQQGWAVGEFGRIISTRDGGETWTTYQSPVKSSLMAVAVSDRNIGVAVGLEGVALRSGDGGRTWLPLPKITGKNLLDVTWDGKQWIAVGDKGVILRGDEAAANWRETELSPGDVSWHTKVLVKDDSLYMAGSSTGVFKAGKWMPFGNSVTSAN